MHQYLGFSHLCPRIQSSTNQNCLNIKVVSVLKCCCFLLGDYLLTTQHRNCSYNAPLSGKQLRDKLSILESVYGSKANTIQFHLFLTLYLFTYFFFCVFMCGGAHSTACVSRSEDKVQGSVLSFHHVHPGDRTWVIGLNGSHCYVLSNLAGPEPFL